MVRVNFDYQIFFINGMSVNEAVTENEDGSYTIFINSNLCEYKRIEAFHHALSHITHQDFEKYDVQEIESAAHASFS